jgi:hypothetical protein
MGGCEPIFFLWEFFFQLAIEKKTQCDFYKRFFLKNLKKIAIFCRKKKIFVLLDLNNESM